MKVFHASHILYNVKKTKRDCLEFLQDTLSLQIYGTLKGLGTLKRLFKILVKLKQLESRLSFP